MSKTTTVLLLEDNPGDADLISEMLDEHQNYTFKLEHKEKLSEVLKLTKEEACSFDITLIDLGLPDSAGLETLESFLEKFSECAVIVITGLNDDETGRIAVQKGAQDYLTKGHINSTLLVRSIFHAIERKQSEEKIKSLLNEKEFLLREVHHRIKNNMMMISSFLSLQTFYLENQEAVGALEEANNRIGLMKSIYEKLYTGEDITELSLDSFLPQLCDEISESFRSGTRISIEADIKPISLTAKSAMPVGIIVNELITNSYKYGFSDLNEAEEEPPKILVSVYPTSDENLEIHVRDNGNGLPQKIISDREYGFGLTLVQNYVDQYNGTMELANNGGAEILVRLSLDLGTSG